MIGVLRKYSEMIDMTIDHANDLPGEAPAELCTEFGNSSRNSYEKLAVLAIKERTTHESFCF